MGDPLTTTALAIVAAGFFVGVVVGLTGMGGGALMTPALIFLGVGDAATVVTADLTAAAVYKTGGAIVHKREGSPHLRLAMWLVLGSVPMALLGPHLINWLAPPGELDRRAEALHRLRPALRSLDLRAAALPEPAADAQRRQRFDDHDPADPAAPDAARRRRSAGCSSASPASARGRSS